MDFASEIIVPLFNKQKPLEEGPLRDSIEAFAKMAERVERLERLCPIVWKEDALYVKSHTGGKDTKIPVEEYTGFLPNDNPGKGPKGSDGSTHS